MKIHSLLLAFTLLFPLGVRAAEDVPFVVTPDNVTLEMLTLAKVGAKDYVIDLGSGDGRIVIAAAKEFGARGLGVDIDPGLVKLSQDNAKKAGVADRAEFREQDLFLADLKPATVVTMYLLPEVNLQMRPSLLDLKPGTRVVSHDWDMGDWKPDQSITVQAPEKKIGRGKTSTIHLWVVPAKVNGTWCGIGSWKGTRIEMAQKFQETRGTVTGGEFTTPQVFNARIEAASLRARNDPALGVTMNVEGDQIVVTSARGTMVGLRSGRFARPTGGSCG